MGTQPMPAVEQGIGGEVRRAMSRQQREAQQRSTLVVNVGTDYWTQQRDHGVYVIPGKHAWTPVSRCGTCGGEEATHEADMQALEDSLRLMQEQGKTVSPNALRGHEFRRAGESCALCHAPKTLHHPKGRYGVLVVRGTLTSQDWGDLKKNRSIIFSDEIASDLIQGQSLLSRGVFAAKGAQPSEAELVAAEERRDRGYLALVQEADSLWMRYHAIHMISDAAKRAGAAMELDREWLYGTKMDCPRCHSKLKIGAAICLACGAILDREKYDAYEPPAAQAETATEAPAKSRAGKKAE